MKKPAVLTALGLLMLLAVACGIPVMQASPLASDYQASRGGLQVRLMAIPPDATPTATPFQPLAPTPFFEPTRFPTQTAVPTATPKPEVAAEENLDTKEIEYIGSYYRRPSDQINILLLGSDQRFGDPSFRTDTIVLATLNPSYGTVSLTSFPRDLYITIPGWTTNRINTVFNLGGFQLMQATFEYNFGIRPDHYVMVNFDAFTRTIDSLGGIKVQVAEQLTDHRDQKGRYTVKSGANRMDGETALWYVRSRYTTSDFDRTRRQQEVIKGLFDQLISLDAIKRVPELYDIYKDTVLTDLRPKDLKPLLPLATKIGQSKNIQNFYIGPQQVSRYIVPTSGADVLLPNQYAVMDVIYQAAGMP
ncbi:MAG: LCP family protein [Anaerolineales bacterium]